MRVVGTAVTTLVEILAVDMADGLDDFAVAEAYRKAVEQSEAKRLGASKNTSYHPVAADKPLAPVKTDDDIPF